MGWNPFTDDQIDPPERANFLRRCWQERRWQEWAAEVLRPAHYRLYRLKQHMLSRSDRAAQVRFHAPQAPPRDFSGAVPNVFAKDVQIPPQLDGVQRLFEDVDRQLDGVYRLAGGGYHDITKRRLEDLEDYEDHHGENRIELGGP